MAHRLESLFLKKEGTNNETTSDSECSCVGSAPRIIQYRPGIRRSRRGKEKNQMCIGCHGIEGYRTSFPTVYQVPRLGGQHAEYIVKALEAYKTGARNHPSMKGIAATLSTKDMEDLAAYYATSGK